MEAQKFTGWVEKVIKDGDYDHKLVVTNARDADMAAQMKASKKEWPITLMFNLSVKSGCSEQLNGINVGDKVVVTFYISGKSGVSRTSGKYYCINSLNVGKKDGLVLLERGSAAKAQEPSPADTDDIPF